jgi:hypothetical protein
LPSPGDAVRGQREPLPEVARVGARVGNHEVGTAKCRTVEKMQGSPEEGPALHEPAVVDHRVLEGDERIEDDGQTASDSLRREHVEMSWVADENDVGFRQRGECEPCFCSDGSNESSSCG